MMIIDDFEAAVDVFVSKHEVTKPEAVRGVVALAALSYAEHLPTELLAGLLAAAERALLRTVPSIDFAVVREQAWQHLEDKHGTSTVVDDDSDKAVRLLIGIAWNEDLPEADVSQMLDYFGNMLSGK